MPNLFLDIETAPDFDTDEFFQTKSAIDSGVLDKNSENRDLYWRFERGGLTPFSGKIILITYQINNAHLFRLKEWEVGEREILKKFYNLIVDLQHGTGEDHLRIIGHNILGFDLFFIYNRMRYHKIIEYSDREFIYPQLYQKILSEGLISKERLLDAIKAYQEAQKNS